MGKFLKISAAVIAVIIIGAVSVLYVAGGSAKINDNVPDIGIDIISMPFGAQRQAQVPIQWLVHGAKSGDAVITGAYFSNQPYPYDFDQGMAPERAGYPNYVPAHDASLGHGIIVQEADLPNVYQTAYVRLYASIGGKNYWTKEFRVTSQ